MPGQIIETYRSRAATEGENPQAELQFVVINEPDDVEVRVMVATASPSSYLGLRRTNYSITPISDKDWDVTVLYQSKADPTYAFDTSGGTAHVKQSIATVGKYAAPGEFAADYEGAIEVSGDSVNGADIVVPVFSFSETHYVTDDFVTPLYKLLVFALTGRVNNATFKGLSRGECLFLGCQGQKQGTGDWELLFKFSASPNAVGLNVGPITIAAKEGWHYQWTSFAEAVDNDAKELIKKPQAAYVEQVYQYGDFSALGIGLT